MDRRTDIVAFCVNLSDISIRLRPRVQHQSHADVYRTHGHVMTEVGLRDVTKHRRHSLIQSVTWRVCRELSAADRRIDDWPTYAAYVVTSRVLLTYLLTKNSRFHHLYLASSCIRSVNYSSIGCRCSKVTLLNRAWRHIFILWRPSSCGFLDVIFNAPRTVTSLYEWRHCAPVCAYI